MNRHWKKFPLIAVLGGAVAVVSLAGLDQRSAESQKAREPVAANLPVPAGREDRDADLAMQRSGDGRRSWSYVIAARELLEADEIKEADRYLDGALKILEEMGDAGADGLVPLYAQIGIGEEVEITGQLRLDIQRLQPHIMRGEHEKVINALGETGLEMRYYYVDMPLAPLQRQLSAARKALAAEDFPRALEALRAAEYEMVIDTVTISGKGA